MEEVIGAQIVSVPMAVPIERANKTFTAFMGSLALVFVAIFVLLNIMLYTMVIRRVTQLAGIADQVSLGNMDAGEFKTNSKDEIGVLTGAMGRMKASLVQAMKMLEG
jgi:protein-histidine pros-kinase